MTLPLRDGAQSVSEIDPGLIGKAERVYAEAFAGSGASSQGQLIGHIARALQDERDGGWQDIETRDLVDGGEFVAWDGHRFDVVCFGWMENGRPVWFNGDVPFDAVAWRPLPRPPHSKDSEG